MINVSGINKYYNKGKNNELHVIDNVSLNLPDTGLITLLGKSGSGKTTILNVIGGLDKATGTITYDEKRIKNYNMTKVDKYRREHIGYVFQNYNLLTDKTVWENLEIALEVINITDKEEVQKRIEYSLKAVGLYKFRKKPAFALSGGQMQRVSIARALVKNSKIIIADEPTGNLDSDNSLEIMNILKKISKTSLVLLVTHDKQLAEFYSDKIIEISDGKVNDIRETSKDASLRGRLNDNVVHLKDLEKIEDEGNKLKYHIYLDDGELENLEFTIVKKNNQLYLKSNQKIKLLEDTHIELVDDHYKEVKKDDISNDLSFDTSWYKDIRSRNFFKRTLANLKASFKNFFVTRKRTKFFHMAFLLIGAVLAFLNISFVTYSKINTESFIYDKDIYSVGNFYEFRYNNDKYKDYAETIKIAFKQGLIDNFYSVNKIFNYRDFNLSSFDSRLASVYYTALDDSLINNSEILVGRKSEARKEVVISNILADNILKQLDVKSATYSSLLGREITSDNSYDEFGNYINTYTIVGVVQKDSKAVYYKERSQNVTNKIVGNGGYGYLKGVNSNAVNYTVVEGKDISSNLEGLVSEESQIKIGDVIDDITIVGKFKIQNFSDFSILENEAVIVNKNTITYIDCNYNSYYNDYYYYYGNSEFHFTTSNIEELRSFLGDNGLVLADTYEVEYLSAEAEGKEAKYVLVPVMLVLLSITLIYIYFSMRSKMISDIYSIGVYRALGFSRARMVAKYMCEIFVVTLFTTLLGYLGVSLAYQVLAVKMSSLGFTLTTLFDYYSTYVVLAGLLALNIFIGLLPIVTLMKKTPSEIIAKYDI